MLGSMLENVCKKTPLVHCITNYVTVNDVANALLACGGSPIMADDMGEAAEITSICNALCINIGTLSSATIPSMKAAGEKSNQLGHPVLLDPVGAGASALRTDTANMLIDGLSLGAIRGNISEIKTLALGKGTTHGVDADVADVVTDEAIPQAVAFAKEFSKKTGAIIAISGAIDIVASGEKAYVIRNGHPLMSKITGSGCMLSAVCTAYLAANQDDPLSAVAAAFVAFGAGGEIAASSMCKGDGNSTFRNRLIDALSNMDGRTLENMAKYEVA